MSNISNVMKEFKVFILKGNIIDIIVGVIAGGAFSETVTSFVNDVLMPLLGALTGGASFNTLKYVIHPVATVSGVEAVEAAIFYGSLLQNTLDFLITGVCMFFMVKTAAVISNRSRHEEEAKEEVSIPVSPTQEEFLAEIRNLLKKHGDTA